MVYPSRCHQRAPSSQRISHDFSRHRAARRLAQNGCAAKLAPQPINQFPPRRSLFTHSENAIISQQDPTYFVPNHQAHAASRQCTATNSCIKSGAMRNWRLPNELPACAPCHPLAAQQLGFRVTATTAPLSQRQSGHWSEQIATRAAAHGRRLLPGKRRRRGRQYWLSRLISPPGCLPCEPLPPPEPLPPLCEPLPPPCSRQQRISQSCQTVYVNTHSLAKTATHPEPPLDIQLFKATCHGMRKLLLELGQ